MVYIGKVRRRKGGVPPHLRYARNDNVGAELLQKTLFIKIQVIFNGQINNKKVYLLVSLQYSSPER